MSMRYFAPALAALLCACSTPQQSDSVAKKTPQNPQGASKTPTQDGAKTKKAAENKPVIEAEIITVDIGKSSFEIASRPGEVACLLGGSVEKAKYPVMLTNKSSRQTLALGGALIRAENYPASIDPTWAKQAWNSKTCKAYRLSPPQATKVD